MVFGKAIKRREDPRLITGEARYLEDLKMQGLAAVAILRSPYAHAKILSIDTSAAEAMDGVIGVFTGKDFEDLNPLPVAWQITGTENFVNPPRALAIDKVTFTGCGVAAVVAENRYIAEDALEQIVVEYEELPVVVDAEKATHADSPQIFENAANNVCMDWSIGDADGTEQALNSADRVITHRIRNQRVIPNPMETRGCAAMYQPMTGEYTVWMTSQAPHVMRLLMTAFVFGIDEMKMRVISPQIGGGFGAKIFLYPEYVLVTALSKKVKRPVKWMETRTENFIATTHGRDHISDVEVGVKNDGTVTGLRVKTYANLGGATSTIAPGIPTTLYARMLSGPYKIENIHAQVLGVYTNTSMVDAYRGAGRPEATYLLERTMNIIADELGLDPVDVRRKNLIESDQFPYDPKILAGLKYDSGNYKVALNRAIEMVDYDGFRQEQAAARADERYLGIGFSSYIEMCGVAPSAWIGMQGEGWGAGLWESANIRVHLTGKVAVTSGSQNHGQGHETTTAQIVANELGIPVEDVLVQHSDTQGTPFGYGSYGSRTASVGQVAVYNSLQRIKKKAKALGAHMLEAAADDVEFVDGKVFVKGSPDNAKTIQEIAGAAALGYDLPEGMEPFLDDTAYYDPPNCTYPFGTHICVVEVMPDSGEVKILRYVAVDDVGKVINPMIVDGQLHGGIAQGVGQALVEGAVYDDSGQLISGSFLDYTMPRADLFPNFELERTETPSPTNPLGVKGAGEAGTIASTPAVVNAVVDALSPMGIKDVAMPMTPYRVWKTIQDAQSNGGGH